MKPIPHEEIGNIRLVMSNEDFAQELINYAKQAGDKLLPDDIENLKSWLELMIAFRMLSK